MTTTLFFNGAIRTNREEGTADWVLVEGDTLRAVGRGSDTPAADRSVDLEGGALVPGFCDAHVHLPATGLYAAGMDFRGEKNADVILRAYQERSADPGALLFGGNFEDPLDRPLTRVDLDSVVGERPALLARADLHSCIVSTALLNQLALSDQPGIDRGDGGEPTGYLREQAASTAWRWFESNLPKQVQIDAIRAAARLAYSKGVTSVHEMFVVEWRGWDSFDVFREATEPLALNVVVYLGTDDVDRVVALGFDHIGGDYFLDGAFGSHTAWMSEPFLSAPPPGTPETGISYRSDDQLFGFFSAAQRAGLQVGVHAIGDAAIEQAISTWERVAGEVGVREVMARGHRIEHFECAWDDHIERAEALGLTASVQPAFDAFWGGENGMYAQRLGWDRASKMNRFGSMDSAGLRMGAGSDSTVTPLDPFVQMRALRLHHVSDERLSAERALSMATIGAHGLAGDDRHRGELLAGSLADLAWLDRDPATTDAEELTKTEVLGAWVAGRRVWPDGKAESR
ncbi:MAG: amidohydrolase [Actinomycetota bacterium]|nr:amidohydrolase [Actinomycetota bacterium]